MRTAIVIPARLQSSRLPRKPLAMLGDVPLVVRVAQQALKCCTLDDPAQAVVVATDSPEIQAVCSQHEVRCCLTSAEHASGSDRVAEAAEQLEADFILNVQGDEPFVDPRDLDAMVSSLTAAAAAHSDAQAGPNTGPKVVTLRAPITDATELVDPNVVKVVTRDDGRALYFSRAPLPHSTRKKGNENDATAPYEGVFKHLGVYGYDRSTLQRFAQTKCHPIERREGLEQLRLLMMGLEVRVLDAVTRGRGIDTAEDLAWAQQRVASLGETAFPGPARQQPTQPKRRLAG